MERKHILKSNKTKKLMLKALKAAVGSSAAIYTAKGLHLDYEISAGTIALLTIVTTKWETLRLSLFRVITLGTTVCLAWLVFTHLDNEWAAYGLFIFLLVVFSEILGWGATIAVNAVIGAHFLTKLEFNLQFILNEFLLVLIGISIAIILNLFHANESSKKELIRHILYVEKQLKMVLGEIAAYLYNQNMQRDVWDDICRLEELLKQYMMDACEYQDNTFSSHPEYYIDYFEMRMQQCNILHNLHYEMKKIRAMPKQAKITADFILYMRDYITENNMPAKQMEQLEKIFKGMKKEPLPQSREEFESRAILYHILMDLEDFLMSKKRFADGLNEQKRRIYWNM